MDKRYTTQEKVEAYLQRELTSEEQTIFDDVLAHISELVSTYTNREWINVDSEGEPVEEIRYYTGTGYPELFIDDFSEITAIDYLDTDGNLYESVLNTDFVMIPQNKTVKSSINLRSGRFPGGMDRIRVTGIFNSGPVPSGVSSITASLIGDYYSNSGSNLTSEFKKESIEGYSYEKYDTVTLSSTQSETLKQLDIYKKVLL